MGDQVQNLPISIANVSPFPSSVTKVGTPTGSFEDKEDESDKVYPIQGRLFKSANYAWLSWGPNLQVVNTATGLQVAGCVVDGGLNGNPVITCVAELPPSDGYCAQLAVGIQCEEDSGLVCIYEALSGNPRIIRTIQMPEKVLSICLITPGTLSDSASPLCSLLCSMGGVLAVGLAGAKVVLLDLKRMAKEYPQDITHQLVSLSPGDNIAEKQRWAVQTGDHLSLLLNRESFSTSQYALLAPDGTNIHLLSKSKVWVTALLYVPQIGSLIVGFNFGCFQIWNLSSLQLEYTSEFLDDPLPVNSLSFQEPSDDPCNCCYLWAVFGSVKFSYQPPLLAMYSLSYKRKQLIPQYGMLYKDFQSCTLSFEHELQNDDVDTSTRFVSCNLIEKTSFPQNIMYNGDDADVSLSMFVWATSHHCHLSLFDLNQWYKDQMPADTTRSRNVNSFWATYSFVEESDKLLDIRMREETLIPFRTAVSQDEHFFPSALAFKSIGLFERKAISCHHPGIQRAVLRMLSDSGSLGIASPTTIYLQCVEVGLRPTFVENVHRMNVTLEDQRNFLLSLALEQHLERLVLTCATSWADGSQGSLGCSLHVWLTWAWQRAYVCKSRVDRLCITLYNHSGESLDQNSYSELDQCFRQLRLLSELYRDVFNFCLKNPRMQIPYDFEQQMQSLEVVSLYVEVVKWFVNIKLLPEFPESSEETSDHGRIPYPVTILTKFYQERRTELMAMNDLNNLTKKISLQGCPDALFIDGLVWHECGGDRLFNVWERDGGSGLYPPPSLQSLLRTYLLDGIPTHVKHSITLYFFLDLSALLEVQDRYHSVFEHFIKFPAAMGVSSSMIKITQGFWLLDHRDFSEAVEMLRDPLVNCKDLKPWQHQLVIKVLIRHGKNKLALDYIRDCDIPMTETENIKLMISLLLSNGFITMAFSFQREHRTKQNTMELLQYFFTGCQERNMLTQVLHLVMSHEEEEAFRSFLETSQHSRAHDLYVLYFLAQSRIVEAVEANENFHPHIVPGTKRMLSLDKNSSVCEEIVRAYAKTIPPATWKLQHYRPKERGASSIWKQVERPVPITISVSDLKKEAAHYRSTFFRTTMEKGLNAGSTVDISPYSTSSGVPAHATPLGHHSNLSRLGIPAQTSLSTPGSRVLKRDRNSSSDALLLLHTPHIRRVSQGTPSLSQTRVSSNFNTPQSILKVRRTLCHSLSQESLPPSLSETATTPDLEEHADDTAEEIVSRSARLIRFDIPSPDASVCSSTTGQVQSEDDADKAEISKKLNEEVYMEVEEETAGTEVEETVEIPVERESETSFIFPREGSPQQSEKKRRTEPSEKVTSHYFLRSPRRSYVGGSPRKPLQEVLEESSKIASKNVKMTRTGSEELHHTDPSLTYNSELHASLGEEEEKDENSLRLHISSNKIDQVDMTDSLEKSSESGEEFSSARSRFSTEKHVPEPLIPTSNIQPRKWYSALHQTKTTVTQVSKTSVRESGILVSSNTVFRHSDIIETSNHGKETSQEVVEQESLVHKPCTADEIQFHMDGDNTASDSEGIVLVENLPISIDTGDLEPDVEIEIPTTVESCVIEEHHYHDEVNVPEDHVQESTLTPLLPMAIQSQGSIMRSSIIKHETSEIVAADSSDVELMECEEDYTVEDEATDEFDGYSSDEPVQKKSRGILPDNSVYIPCGIMNSSQSSLPESSETGISEDPLVSVLSSSQVDMEAQSKERSPEIIEGKSSENEVLDYDYKTNEEEEDIAIEEEELCCEDDEEIVELDKNNLEVSPPVSKPDNSSPSKHGVMEHDTKIRKTNVLIPHVIQCQSSDESDILEIGGDETIRDIVGNETVMAIMEKREECTSRASVKIHEDLQDKKPVVILDIMSQDTTIESSHDIAKNDVPEISFADKLETVTTLKSKEDAITDGKTEEKIEDETPNVEINETKRRDVNEEDIAISGDEARSCTEEEDIEEIKVDVNQYSNKFKGTKTNKIFVDAREDDDEAEDGEMDEVEEEEEEEEELDEEEEEMSSLEEESMEEEEEHEQEEEEEEEESEHRSSPIKKKENWSDHDDSSIICLSSSESDNEGQSSATTKLSKTSFDSKRKESYPTPVISSTVSLVAICDDSNKMQTSSNALQVLKSENVTDDHYISEETVTVHHEPSSQGADVSIQGAYLREQARTTSDVSFLQSSHKTQDVVEDASRGASSSTNLNSHLSILEEDTEKSVSVKQSEELKIHCIQDVKNDTIRSASESMVMPMESDLELRVESTTPQEKQIVVTNKGSLPQPSLKVSDYSVASSTVSEEKLETETNEPSELIISVTEKESSVHQDSVIVDSENEVGVLQEKMSTFTSTSEVHLQHSVLPESTVGGKTSPILICETTVSSKLSEKMDGTLVRQEISKIFPIHSNEAKSSIQDKTAVQEEDSNVSPDTSSNVLNLAFAEHDHDSECIQVVNEEFILNKQPAKKSTVKVINESQSEIKLSKTDKQSSSESDDVFEKPVRVDEHGNSNNEEEPQSTEELVKPAVEKMQSKAESGIFEETQKDIDLDLNSFKVSKMDVPSKRKITRSTSVEPPSLHGVEEQCQRIGSRKRRSRSVLSERDLTEISDFSLPSTSRYGQAFGECAIKDVESVTSLLLEKYSQNIHKSSRKSPEEEYVSSSELVHSNTSSSLASKMPEMLEVESEQKSDKFPRRRAKSEDLFESVVVSSSSSLSAMAKDGIVTESSTSLNEEVESLIPPQLMLSVKHKNEDEPKSSARITEGVESALSQEGKQSSVKTRIQRKLLNSRDFDQFDEVIEPSQLKDSVANNAQVLEEVPVVQELEVRESESTEKGYLKSTNRRRAKSDLGNVDEIPTTVDVFSREGRAMSSETEVKGNVPTSRSRRAKSNLGNLQDLKVTVVAKKGRQRPRSVSDLETLDDKKLKPGQRKANSLYGDVAEMLPKLELVKIDPLVSILTKGRHSGKTPAKIDSSDRVESVSSSSAGPSSAAMIEFAASRRLTRHQKAILERSGNISFQSHGVSESEENQQIESHTTEVGIVTHGDISAQVSEKVLTPTRRSARIKASTQASEHGSPASSVVSDCASSVYSLRSKRSVSEVSVKGTSSPRRKRKNVLEDEIEDEKQTDASSVASDISTDTTDSVLSVKKTRSVDGDFTRSQSTQQTKVEEQTTTKRKRIRTMSESNLDISGSRQSPRRSICRLSLATLTGGLETIKEEPVSGEIQEKTPIQEKRQKKTSKRSTFISPITEEERQLVKDRMSRLPAASSSTAQPPRRACRTRNAFQLINLKRKEH